MNPSQNPQPKKDVIYVDIEDDITAIIGKVKDSKTPIVALVPPKRIGVLQSVVNLKLLHRVADQANKRLVIITNDTALSTLAAGIKIPIAKNLQSKPELAELTAVNVDDEEVITGDELPIHDGTKIAEPITNNTNDKTVGAAASAASLAPKKRDIKIPNFETFRNNIFLFSGLGVFLIGLLIWAIFFAPNATVTITARTTSYDINKKITARPNSTLDASKGTVAATVKEIKKTSSVDFTATGKKDIGTKATGTIALINCTDNPDTIVAGTIISARGQNFTVNADVLVPNSTFKRSGSCNDDGNAPATVTAQNNGDSYNLANQSFQVAGHSDMKATGTTSGGVSKVVTVVSEQDAASAKEKLATQDINAVKAELKKQFNADQVIVNESFGALAGNPQISPAIDQEASNGKYTLETTYTMLGIARSDLKTIVEQDITAQVQGLPNQKIYENGMGSLSFSKVVPQDNGFDLIVETTGYVGPSINSAQLVKQLTGKREGEIQAQVKTYEGVSDVNVKFSPFWVSKAPAADKITIKFEVNDNAKQ